MATGGDVSADLDTGATRPRRPLTGQRVAYEGRPGTVVDVADYPHGLCQVVVALDGPSGRPSISVPLEDLDLGAGSGRGEAPA